MPATSSRPSRDFHRLGLIFAVIVGAIGLALIAPDAVTLRLWDVSRGDLHIVIIGALIGLVEIVIVCLVAYGLVRAIGWIVGRFRGA